MSIAKKGKSTWNKGKKMAWIYNEEFKKTKLILENNLQEFLNEGWKRGKKKF